MYKIEKADLNKNDIEQLCRLSEIWASEDISWGIVANTIDDIKQRIQTPFFCDLLQEEFEHINQVIYTREKYKES